MSNNKFFKNIILHIKYPYTALIIAVMWIGMAIILTYEPAKNFEILFLATSVSTLIIALIGFRSPK